MGQSARGGSHVLQAMVSEPVKPVLDTVVTSGAVHFYISQSDKGELVMGGDLDFYNSYAQRGNLPAIEHVVSACLALFPSFLRKLPKSGGWMNSCFPSGHCLRRRSRGRGWISLSCIPSFKLINT